MAIIPEEVEFEQGICRGRKNLSLITRQSTGIEITAEDELPSTQNRKSLFSKATKIYQYFLSEILVQKFPLDFSRTSFFPSTHYIYWL